MVIPRGENVLLWDVTTYREPAVVGAAADDPDVMPELICDGIHIHPCMVRNTFRLFGAHRMILISDSMRAVGMEDGQYTPGRSGGYRAWSTGYLGRRNHCWKRHAVRSF